jgi:hypothetical protein
LQHKKNIKGVDFILGLVLNILPVNYKIGLRQKRQKELATIQMLIYIDNLPEYGFGSQSNYAASGEYNTKGILMSTFGFTFQMGEKSFVRYVS